MLTLTENAVTAIEELVANAADELVIGIRIESGREDQPSKLEVRLAKGIGADDEVVSRDGARVVLDQAAASALDAKLLDASLSDDGVRFTIKATS